MGSLLSDFSFRMASNPRRGRSKSRERHRHGDPPIDYTETSKTMTTTTKHKYASDCFDRYATDCYATGYDDGVKQATRMMEATSTRDDNGDEDDWDPSNLCRLRKREIIHSIGQLAEPQSKLDKLVKEYKEVDEEEREYDSDAGAWGENSDDGESDGESEYDNVESETEHNDGNDKDNTGEEEESDEENNKDEYSDDDYSDDENDENDYSDSDNTENDDDSEKTTGEKN